MYAYIHTHYYGNYVIISCTSCYSDVESKGTKPPPYDMKPRDLRAPPTYNDALYDKLAGEQETTDDKTPLHP